MTVRLDYGVQAENGEPTKRTCPVVGPRGVQEIPDLEALPNPVKEVLRATGQAHTFSGQQQGPSYGLQIVQAR